MLQTTITQEPLHLGTIKQLVKNRRYFVTGFFRLVSRPVINFWDSVGCLLIIKVRASHLAVRGHGDPIACTELLGWLGGGPGGRVGGPGLEGGQEGEEAPGEDAGGDGEPVAGAVPGGVEEAGEGDPGQAGHRLHPLHHRPQPRELLGPHYGVREHLQGVEEEQEEGEHQE